MTSRTKTEYLHGVDPEEQARLERQHRYVGGISFLPTLEVGASALDVGCGPGLATCDLAARLAPGEVVGIDASEAQVEAARRRADDAGLANVELHVGPALPLPFGDGRFDLVFCRFLLEHVAEPLAVLEEMTRVARPGGWVVVCECRLGSCSQTEPPTAAVETAFDALYTLQRRRGGSPEVAAQLEPLFASAGLSEVEADTLVAMLDTPEAVRGYADGGAKLLRASEADLLAEGLLSAEALAAALSDYARLCASPGARAWFNLQRVQGRRPHL